MAARLLGGQSRLAEVSPHDRSSGPGPSLPPIAVHLRSDGRSNRGRAVGGVTGENVCAIGIDGMSANVTSDFGARHRAGVASEEAIGDELSGSGLASTVARDGRCVRGGRPRESEGKQGSEPSQGASPPGRQRPA